MTLLTARDVATRWGVSDQTVYNIHPNGFEIKRESDGLNSHEARESALGLPHRVDCVAVIDQSAQVVEQGRIIAHREACNLVRYLGASLGTRGRVGAIYRPRAATYR